MTSGADELASVLRAGILQPVPPDVTALADAIVQARGDCVAAVLFYGSCLRESSADGILDFYVLVDDYRRYHGRWLPAALNRLLPPTVSLWVGAGTTRAKVAVISRDQFARRMRAGGLDVTLWSRFCQPAALVHARDPEMVDWTVEVLGRAVSTAALWARQLGPAEGSPEECWLALFRQTYRAELRPETRDRAAAIYAAAGPRYERLWHASLARAGAVVERGSVGRFRSPLLRGPAGWWWPRRTAGKLLAAARLARASFTFANGADYIAWKIERHTGQRIDLAPWQRNHPLIAAPLILWRLWRSGTVR